MATDFEKKVLVPSIILFKYMIMYLQGVLNKKYKTSFKSTLYVNKN